MQANAELAGFQYDAADEGHVNEAGEAGMYEYGGAKTASNF